MNIKRNGYIVLRKPEYNFDKLGRGAFSMKAPKLDTIYYGGIDRMQWFDVDEDFYNQTLPNNIFKIRENIFKDSPTNTDIKICSNINDAKELLRYSNKNINRNEILVIYSPLLADCKESSIIDVEEDSIGCDLYCEGYGSIIKEGIFTKPKLFKEFADEINKKGIFDIKNKSISRYIQLYNSLSKEGELEKMVGPVKKIFLYKIESKGQESKGQSHLK